MMDRIAARLTGVIGAAAIAACAAWPAAAATDFEIKSGQWVEGPGYRVVWDMGPRALCEAACRADARCTMFEYWKPRQKCNLYDHTRIRGPSRESDVGLRAPAKP